MFDIAFWDTCLVYMVCLVCFARQPLLPRPVNGIYHNNIMTFKKESPICFIFFIFGQILSHLGMLYVNMLVTIAGSRSELDSFNAHTSSAVGEFLFSFSRREGH